MGSPNVASGDGLSKAGAFERFIVAKTTNSSDTTTSGNSNTAGDMTFLVDNPSRFSVGDYVSGNNIRKNTRVTAVGQVGSNSAVGTSATIHIDRPLKGNIGGSATVSIFEVREAAGDGPPAFELKAGTNTTIQANATNAVGATVLQINSTASGGSTVNNPVENRLVTVGAVTTEFDSEANLTYDGNQLVMNYDVNQTTTDTKKILSIDVDKGSTATAASTSVSLTGGEINLHDAATNNGTSTVTKTGLVISNTSANSTGTTKNVGLDISVTGADDNYAAVFQSGNVGIGTSTPDFELQLEGSSSTGPVFNIKNTHTDNNGGEMRFWLADTGNGANGDTLGTISFYGNDNGGADQVFAKIISETEDVTAGSEEGRMLFQVATAASSGSLDSVLTLVGGATAAASTITSIGNFAASQDVAITGDITTVTNVTATNTVQAADVTATDDLTAQDDLVMGDSTNSKSSKIRPASKSGSNVSGNNLALSVGQGTGTGSSRIDFFTKSADGTGATDAYSTTNTIVMKDGKLGIGDNVASDVSGNIITHHLTLTKDTDAEFVAMALTNRSDSNDTNGSVSMLFNLEDTSGNTVDAAKIKVVKNAAFTSTAGTQDANIEFHTSEDGVLGKKFEILSSGTKVTGDLEVTGDLNITGDINSTSVTDLDVVDMTITVASGSTNSAQADGSGIIFGGSGGSLLYEDTGTKFLLNKPLDITGALNVTGTITGDTSLTLDAVTIETAEIQVLDGVTAGQVTASRALVVDSNRDLDNANQIRNLRVEALSVDAVAVLDTSTNTAQTFVSGTGFTIAQFAFGTYRTVKFVGHIVNDTTHDTDAFEVLVSYKGDAGPRVDSTSNFDADTMITTYAYMSSGTALGGLSLVKTDPGSTGTDTHIALQFTNSTGSNFTGSFAVTATQLIKT